MDENVEPEPESVASNVVESSEMQEAPAMPEKIEGGESEVPTSETAVSAAGAATAIMTYSDTYQAMEDVAAADNPGPMEVPRASSPVHTSDTTAETAAVLSSPVKDIQLASNAGVAELPPVSQAPLDLAPPAPAPAPPNLGYSAMEDAVMDRTFRVKEVAVFGRPVPVILQDTNGPCPLLSIANLLLLKGSIQLPDLRPVHLTDLMARVASCLLDSVGSESEAFDLNRQQNIADAVAELPKLATGLDVNVKFTGGIAAFEFTAETAIFDLLRIPLVHGWLADPSDPGTFGAWPLWVLNGLSYNQLAEHIISQKFDPGQEHVAQEFLAASSSQLTYYGLAQLHQGLRDDTFCVFFRNNHFCTAYKNNGFYLLVTDEGYRTEGQLVWERLAQVDGDTQFCTGTFQAYEASSDHLRGAGVTPSGYATAEDDDMDEDVALARRLQREEDDAATAAMIASDTAEADARAREGWGADQGQAGPVQQIPHQQQQQQQYVQPQQQMQPTPQQAQPTSRGTPEADRICAAAEQADPIGLKAALAAGISANVADMQGRRPLHWAALEGCEECCRLLASAGAVIVAQDDYGQTALHLACLRSHFDVALQLLEYGARIGIKDKSGKTPMDMAKSDEIQLLLSNYQEAPPPPPPRAQQPQQQQQYHAPPVPSQQRLATTGQVGRGGGRVMSESQRAQANQQAQAKQLRDVQEEQRRLWAENQRRQQQQQQQGGPAGGYAAVPPPEQQQQRRPPTAPQGSRPPPPPPEPDVIDKLKSFFGFGGSKR